MDILRFGSVLSCSEIHSMKSLSYACCYAGHRTSFGSQKCDDTRTHSSMCSLTWKEMWLTIFEISNELHLTGYHIPLDLFFLADKTFCDVEEYFVFTTQIKVELSLSYRLVGSKDEIAYKTGTNLIYNLLEIENVDFSGFLNTISFFSSGKEESRLNMFSVKIVFFDRSNLDTLVSFQRTTSKVNKMVALFLHHFENGRLMLDDAHLIGVLKLQRAGKCVTFKCESTDGSVTYDSSTSLTTKPTTTNSPPKTAGPDSYQRSTSSRVSSFPSAVTLLGTFCCVLLIDILMH